MSTTRFARPLAAAALAAFAALVLAQSPPPMTIGILSSGTYEGRESMDRSLIEGLRAQGYVEGKNLTVVRRYGSSAVPQSAVELAGMRLDAVLTTCTPSTRMMR
ncbi:MAG TPA: hypothetical protein VII68_03600, partial [Casimicrobiaceae bacterium]